jgi:S-adenosyl methyltransferase
MPEDWMKGEPTPSALPPDYFQAPSPAALWNYLLGGKDNYPRDQAAAELMTEAYPDMRYMAEQSRLFLTRAVHYVSTTGGVRQFLDIGCGLPAPRPELNTHEVAQNLYADSRIVYVDNDKVVLAHARALLVSSVPNAGQIDYVDSDARNVQFILDEAGRTLNFGEPIAIMGFGLLGHIADYHEAKKIVTELLAAVPSGSYLLLEDGVNTDSGVTVAVEHRKEKYGGTPYVVRSPEEFSGYFHGLRLVEPGVVPTTLWRPGPHLAGSGRWIASRCGVGRKP